MKHNQEDLQNFYSKGAMPASSFEENQFLVWDRREGHRQVLNRCKIKSFPTMSTLVLPVVLPFLQETVTDLW